MSAYTLFNLSNYLDGLNAVVKDKPVYDCEIVLSGVVTDPNGAVLGKIVLNPDDGKYAFVPGAYEVYNES